MVEKPLKVFMSYSTKDSEIFDVPLISRTLESKSYPEIEKVLYCQRDAGENWVDYMNENIPKSDVFLLFCTPNIYESRYIKDEWQTAYNKDIPIIPVFVNRKHIPDIISNRNGIEFDQFNKAEAIHNLCDFILSVSGIERTEDMKAKFKEEGYISRESLKLLLRKLKYIEGTQAVAIISSQGLPLVESLPSGLDATRIAAMTAALLSLAERAIQEMRKGEFNLSITAGNNGSIIVYSAGPNAVITISFDELIDLNEALREIKPIAEKIAEIL